MDFDWFDADAADPIEDFQSRGASAVQLASGVGSTLVYAIHFEPGGVIGPHQAGFDQIFLVVGGAGWAAGADGMRRPLVSGQAARFSLGELHSKGSDTGMTAIMIQSERLEYP